MSYEVFMSKAGMGDCILLRLGEAEKKLNVLIDSGKNQEGYKSIIQYIEDKKEKINYMVITHDDDDHLNGFYKMLKTLEKSPESTLEPVYGVLTEESMIMNYWRKAEKVNLSSYQVAEIERMLKKEDIEIDNTKIILADPDPENPEIMNIIQIRWRMMDGKLESHLSYHTEMPSISEEWEHAEMVILSPSRANLKKYLPVARTRYEESKKNKNLSSSSQKKDNDWNYSVQSLVEKPFAYKEDVSEPNNASISFLLFYHGTCALLAGDASPEDMCESGKRFLKFLERNRTVLPAEYLKTVGEDGKTIHLDYMKLPHHGSSHNNSLEFHAMFPANCYLLSTKGHNKYRHPGKMTIVNIAKVHKQIGDGAVTIYCNYAPWNDIKLGFKDYEKAAFRKGSCPLLFPENIKFQVSFTEMTNKEQAIGNDIWVRN